MSEFLRYKVYDIKIYNKSYIGCTGQLPTNRLQLHLECCHAVGKTHNQEFYSSFFPAAELLASIVGNEENMEGVSAFLEKRPTDFRKYRR